MNLQTAIDLFNKLESGNTYDRTSAKNYYSRSYARSIYFEVGDDVPLNITENLDNGSDNLAFSYLSIGCCMYEENYIETKNQKHIRRISLERGAELIEYTHLAEQNRNELSPYYLLVGALAYYAANQYSKSFILMKKTKDIYETDISILTNAFLRKDFDTVGNILNKVLLNDNYIEEFELQFNDKLIQVILYAKSFANLMDFLYSGNQNSLSQAKIILEDLLELLLLEREASLWWVVRILKILVNGFETNSLWNTVLPKIPDDKYNLTTRYINNLIFSKNRVVELFIAQKNALSTVLSNKGSVISLPTSSGKTRIAEIAILKCLSENSEAKILYLAPFRSLAYEVENTLSEIFENLGFNVSQLYGTGQFSQIDNLSIKESSILIATPEKAKVILRADNENITKKIKLVIIDEGHLLNTEDRQVRNEFFIEELKKYTKNSQGKIILLTAVLPNTEEIAKWITSKHEPSFISETERVAKQRLGILEFKRGNVDLEWFSEEKPFKFRKNYDTQSNNSYNSQFIKSTQIKKGKSFRVYPENQKEAIANVGLKLSLEKPILIFIAKANMIFAQAEAIYVAIKNNNQLMEHSWGHLEDWKKFELLCLELNSKQSLSLLKYAKYGILCHKRNIDENIKITIENLIRRGNPKIIIGNKTLGQGVNLGVSSIIVGTVDYDYDKVKKEKKNIKENEFWNIVGRAGRAFIDNEGKILFSVSDEKDKNLALKYFNSEPDKAISGILSYIRKFKNLAKENDIPFENLLNLISENCLYENINPLDQTRKDKIEKFFELADDPLLSLEIQFEEDEDIFNSIEDHFRQTLAYIQAANYNGLSPEDVVSVLKARSKAIREKIIPDKSKWKTFISSGLPLLSAIRLDELFNEIIEKANAYLLTDKNIQYKIQLLAYIEKEIIKKLPSSTFNEIYFDDKEIDLVRINWICGDSINSIKKSQEICFDYYSYKVSWVLGAIANKF